VVMRRMQLTAAGPLRTEDLSEGLAAAVESWQRQGAAWIGSGVDGTPSPSEQELREWAADGEVLARRLGAELGDDVYVEYLPRHPAWAGRWPYPHSGSAVWSPLAGPPLPPPPPLPGPEVLIAVRAMIAREIERVDDPISGVPGGDPSDVAGWHPGSAEKRPRGPGRPVYDPEVWRWFQLADLAYLDELVLVEFYWTNPATPLLRHLLFCHVDGLTTAESAAMVVRGQLRAALAPGWRERLAHRWVGHDRVLLSRDDERSQQVRDDHLWDKPRHA
jgi:hypothetical protein